MPKTRAHSRFLGYQHFQMSIDQVVHYQHLRAHAKVLRREIQGHILQDILHT